MAHKRSSFLAHTAGRGELKPWHAGKVKARRHRSAKTVCGTPCGEWRAGMQICPSRMQLHRGKCRNEPRACFPSVHGRYRRREAGGGRATRQPGQIRKEAAVTSAVRVDRQTP